MPRIIYYYQTFCGLDKILYKNTPVTHLHVSSIHFGNNNDGSPYIHLNDNSPNDKKFNSLWNNLKNAKNNDIKIILMVGGAGGAYGKLFSDFDTYYNMLKQLILDKKDIIDGIDLDIEEEVDIKNIIMLIKKLLDDFGYDFIISMAPLATSLDSDIHGMGGFIYKDILNSDIGKHINYFNAQAYDEYSVELYDDIIKNGYDPKKVVFGMISSQDFDNVTCVVKNLFKKYKSDFGGVYVWEYFNAPPDTKNQNKWAEDIKTIFNNNFLSYTLFKRKKSFNNLNNLNNLKNMVNNIDHSNVLCTII